MIVIKELKDSWVAFLCTEILSGAIAYTSSPSGTHGGEVVKKAVCVWFWGLESFCFRKGEVGCGFLEGGGGLEIGHAGETDVADVTGDDKGLGVVYFFLL